MPRTPRFAAAIAVLVLFSRGALFSQTVSEKEEIAVFRLSTYSWDIPNEVLGGIDEEIRAVFINIGRFDVIGLTQRLEEGDVNQFIGRLKQYKERSVELSQDVQMGREFFTQADFDRLTGSFVVVVPTVASYVLAPKDGEFKANIKTSFTFINVEQGKTFAQVFVETEGSDEVPELAVKAAIDAIPLQLTFQIRKIPEFQLRTGILEVGFNQVVLELGRNMGIQVGDEYVIVAGRVLGSGHTLTRETGLLVVKEVSDEVSVARIIYARPRPDVGDQLQELPRLGTDTTPYVHVASGLLGPRETTVTVGLRQAVSRGFYGFRPFVGLEVPAIANIVFAIPMNLYVGGEYDLYFGRFQLVPMGGIGAGGAYLWYLGEDVPDERKFVLTHLGGLAGVNLNYLFHKNYRFSIEAGYMGWLSLVPTKVFRKDLLFPDYDGLYVGAGLTIKY